MVTIPFFDLPSFTEEVVLDGASYLLDLTWNDREASWSLGFFTPSGDPLVTGIRLVLDYDLTSQYVGLGLPPGQLLVIDPAGKADNISREALPSGDLLLVYIPEAEVVAL